MGGEKDNAPSFTNCLFDSPIWYSYTAHVLIEQINADQLNTSLEMFVTMNISARPAKILDFSASSCKLTYILCANYFFKENEEIIVIWRGYNFKYSKYADLVSP